MIHSDFMKIKQFDQMWKTNIYYMKKTDSPSTLQIFGDRQTALMNNLRGWAKQFSHNQWAILMCKARINNAEMHYTNLVK